MSKEKAKTNYIKERLNCAQAVIKAFKDEFGIEEDVLRAFESHGGGRAPDGLCGAYFAARHLLEKKHPEKLGEFERYFFEKAASLKCKDIRQIRKLSCVGCVEKAAEFLEGMARPVSFRTITLIIPNTIHGCKKKDLHRL